MTRSSRSPLARRLRVALVVALFAAGFSTWFAVVRWDAPLPDDADLLIDLTPIPESDNGVVHLRTAVDAGAEGDSLISAIALSLESPAFGISDSDAVDMAEANAIRLAVEAIEARVGEAIQQSRAEDAVDHAIVGLRLGERWCRTPRTIFEGMVALWGPQRAIASTTRILDELELTDEQLEQLALALRNHRIDRSLPECALRGEYSLARKRFVDTGGIPVSWRWKPGHTFTILADELRTWVAHCDGPIVPFPGRTGRPGSQRFASWNSTGKHVLETHLEAWPNLLEAFAKGCIAQASTEIRVVVERFRRVHGAIPETLDALVPTFLDAVPTDPFDGKPLRYDPVRTVVWSVGIDGVDSGGSSGVEGEDPAEPTYRVGTKEETRAPSGSPR